MNDSEGKPRKAKLILEEDEEEKTMISNLNQIPSQQRKERHAYLIVLAGADVGAVFRLNSKQ